MQNSHNPFAVPMPVQNMYMPSPMGAPGPMPMSPMPMSGVGPVMHNMAPQGPTPQEMFNRMMQHAIDSVMQMQNPVLNGYKSYSTPNGVEILATIDHGVNKGEMRDSFSFRYDDVKITPRNLEMLDTMRPFPMYRM